MQSGQGEGPGQVAVLSGDEDRSKCELSSPTVSALEIPAAQIGYEAAALLDRLMAGEPVPREPILIPPSGRMAIRESSDISDLVESVVYRALNFIRDHAGEPITVPQVAESIVVSQRSLERNFQRVLGARRTRRSDTLGSSWRRSYSSKRTGRSKGWPEPPV